MELVLATRNTDKIKEIEKVLKGLNLKILTFRDFPNFPSPIESALTLEENALIKARAVAAFTGKLSLADDSGLEVQALHGAPGIYSSRFAGDNVSYEANNRKLLFLLKDVPEEKRDATFRCVMALVSPEAKEMVVEGTCPGKITTFLRGEAGFGYDPVFEPSGCNKTFAEISLTEKNRISHRAKALVKVREALEELTAIRGKFLVGLTGGIGCGKSTVAKFFDEWGLKVIKADEIGHQLLQKDDVKKKLSLVFGDDILNEKGNISRAKLRQKTLLDKEKLHRLNEILHPLIKKVIWNLLKKEKNKIVVIEAALIFEVGWDFFMKKIVTVHCSQNKQIERIRKNTHLSAEEIQAFLCVQLPEEEKMKRADFVIPNEKDMTELEVKAKEVFAKILRESRGGSKS
ncbi:dephospho-CoA kinase [Candidatus Aerophobetes bacterium]|nr:dephospho-CoA kinase [Candidatus Aerophobetes bacterium]